MQKAQQYLLFSLFIVISAGLLIVSSTWNERVLAGLSICLLLLLLGHATSLSRAIAAVRGAVTDLRHVHTELETSVGKRFSAVELAIHAIEQKVSTRTVASPVVVQRMGASWRAVATVAMVLLSIQAIILVAGYRYIGGVERGISFLRSRTSEISNELQHSTDLAADASWRANSATRVAQQIRRIQVLSKMKGNPRRFVPTAANLAEAEQPRAQFDMVRARGNQIFVSSEAENNSGVAQAAER